MKIIQLSTFFHPVTGGVETHVLNLSKELIKNGHEVLVYTSDSTKISGRLAKSETNFFGINVLRFRSWLDLSYYHKFYPGVFWALLKENYDIVHVHGLRKTESYMALLACKLKKKKVVLTTHNPFATTTRNNFAEKLIGFHDFFIGRLLIKHFDKIITIVPSEEELLYKKFGVPKKKIINVPNGVEEIFFTKGDAKNFYKEWNIEPDKWDGIVVSIGRISKGKGVQNLKESVKRLKNVLFFVAGGDDGYLKVLKNMYNKYDNIIFSEKFLTPEKQIDMYDAADVMVMPSFFEAFGIVVLEALAQGIPVLSTNKGGPSEVFNEIEAVKLVDPFDQDAWQVSIEAIVKNKPRAQALGKSGQIFAEKFRWEKITKTIIKVYEEVSSSQSIFK